jgi:hypothetical protein
MSDIQAETVRQLNEHVVWYARWSRFYGIAFNGGTLLSIFFSTATSIIVAMKVEKYYLGIILPATSAMIGTLLIHFRVRDIWRLRENGRIKADRLIIFAHAMPDDPVDSKKAQLELLVAANKLEEDQVEGFFSDPQPIKSV